MGHQPEYYTSKPNLLQVAQEISSYENPERVANTLLQVLAGCAGIEPPAPLPEPEGQTNNERFNVLLNSCQNRRSIYNALATFAEAGEEAAG